MGPPLLLLAALLLCAAADVPPAGGGGGSGVQSCTETRQALAARGFSPASLPPGFISGEHLRICPQESTCCGRRTEEQLSQRGGAYLRALVAEAAAFLLSTLNSRQHRFQDFFLELLAGAEHSLQNMFTRSYGHLYAQHARLFQGLFVELRRHLQGSQPGLEEALGDFWAQLLERMVPLLNPQYSFPVEYLECVGRQADELRAFGDSPRLLRMQLSPTGECRRAHTRLSYCPLCRGTPALKACSGFCLNVMKGCLASTAEMEPEWERYLDAMIQLAERLGGPFNFELAADSIGVKISEGIMYLQEHGVQTSAKVFQSCGSPRPAPARSRRASHEETKWRFRTYSPEEKPTTAAGTNLDRLISDVKEKLRLMRRFWVMLPHTLCSDEKVAADVTNEDLCWNGQTRGRYLPDVTGDGLVNQINNPEVEVDVSQPDLPTRQHLLALRGATSHLLGACNGQDVDFQDADEDGGSGSGAGYHEDRPALGEGRRVVGVVPSGSHPPHSGKGSSSSSQHSQSSGARATHPTKAPLSAVTALALLCTLVLLGG
ncbi:glypican-2 isoform X2 [Paroedura picta]|uniref:glypican-2 isoform X2 n=1 Tax=Paroedura picta TaxID=143630 RepID=UPI004055B7E2